jgi:hypothetical protein
MTVERNWAGEFMGSTQTQAKGAVEDWNTSDAQGNVLFFPTKEKLPSTIVTGPLEGAVGGDKTDGTLRPRVLALIGPGATLLGLAQRLKPFYTKTPSPPRDGVIARAILVYNLEYLIGTSPATPFDSNFRVGLRLPLPIERDTSTNSLVVNSDFVHQLASSPLFHITYEVLLQRRCALLPLPDEDALPNEARDFLLQNVESARAANFRSRLLKNPFEAVFFAFELLRHPLLKAPDEFCLTLLSMLVDHQLEFLDSLTAGNAILRRIEKILMSSRPPTLLVAQALDRLSRAQQSVAVFAERREVPETEQQLDSRGELLDDKTEPVKGNHRMVLGRSVAIGEMLTTSLSLDTVPYKFRGPVYRGRIDPTDFLESHQALLNPTNSSQLEARLKVASKIAATEGKLDAVQMCDFGIISCGIQQWTIKEDNELVPLLAQFKEASPDEFFLYFQAYGIDVKPRKGGFTLWSNQLNSPIQAKDRFDFFGGTFIDNNKTKPNLTKPPATIWAARFRLAALTSLAYKVAQWRHTSSRFGIIKTLVGDKLKIKGVKKELAQTFNSEFGAAIIMDSHINAPGYLLSALVKSFDDNAKIYSDDPDKNVAFVTKAVEDFDRNRRFGRGLSDAQTAKRKNKIRNMGFSKVAGSFKGW